MEKNLNKREIEIPEPEKVFNEIYLPLIENKKETRKPLIVLEGGRGSGKSKAIAQMAVLRALKKKSRIGLIRKVAETIRTSLYQEIKDAVNDWNLQSLFTFLTSPLSIKTINGSEFVCLGLDKAEKVKSLANIDLLIVEEATELTHDDWITLSLTIRGSALKQKVLLFNRKSGNWTEEHFFNANGIFKEDEGIYHLHTTFADNKYLHKSFLDELESLKLIDYSLYEKNALGLPIRLKGLIYTNWDIVPAFPDNCKEIIYGLDFGFNDPMVLTKCGRIENEIWLQCKYYETEKTTGDLIKLLPELIHNKNAELYCDSAEPDRIEEIYRFGYNSRPSEKSVEDGIDVCKRFKIHIVNDSNASTYSIKDIENYKWAEDKNGKSLDGKPNHSYSHFPDSFRYPIFTHWGKDYRNVTAEDLRTASINESEISKLEKSQEYSMGNSAVSSVRGFF